MKMEPIEGSESSAFKTQSPGKYPKENMLHKEHGESLKLRDPIYIVCVRACVRACARACVFVEGRGVEGRVGG